MSLQVQKSLVIMLNIIPNLNQLLCPLKYSCLKLILVFQILTHLKFIFWTATDFYNSFGKKLDADLQTAHKKLLQNLVGSIGETLFPQNILKLGSILTFTNLMIFFCQQTCQKQFPV